MSISKLEIFGPLTEADRDALVANSYPQPMVIFNSDTGGFEFWDGSGWRSVPGFAGDLTCNEIQVASPAAFTANGALISTAVQTRLGESIVDRQGSSVAAANNLAVTGGNSFEITGATQINLISRSPWGQAGAVITLLFASTPTVKHGQATSGTDITIRLAGAVDFVATAGDTLTLALLSLGGVEAWREIGRAVI